MPRLARIVVPGVAHHVTQRGNNQQNVFFVDDDRRAYLDLLCVQGEQYGFRLDGYCLMSNHIHLVGTPAEENSLAKAIGRTHVMYSQYLNRMHGRSGHLWQNRFYSCPMDDDHTLNALSYVELNPVRAGLVKKPWDYPWSSAAVHCGVDEGSPYLDVKAWRRRIPTAEWKGTLKEIAGDKAAQTAVQRNTRTGRPLGSDSFLSKIERKVGRRVRALPVGRQKGWRKKKETGPNEG
ncbi:MAG: transposase [bacterium]|nr:transposase [bacterium]